MHTSYRYVLTVGHLIGYIGIWIWQVGNKHVQIYQRIAQFGINKHQNNSDNLKIVKYAYKHTNYLRLFVRLLGIKGQSPKRADKGQIKWQVVETIKQNMCVKFIEGIIEGDIFGNQSLFFF